MKTPNRTAFILAFALTSSASAQGTNDESRLTVGIIGGWIGGGQLWHTVQPAYTSTAEIDKFDLNRELRDNITVTGQVTFFPTPRFGWTGEITYIGLGARDHCHMAVDHGDQINNFACATINDANRSASAVAALGGIVLRPFSRGDIQPYLRATAGLALVPRSHTSMAAFFGEEDIFAVIIYNEDGSRSLTPVGALSLGLATAPGSSYQFRIEARANVVRLQTVDGPTPLGVTEPSIRSRWQVLPSISVGMDIVLEKRRGRRY